MINLGDFDGLIRDYTCSFLYGFFEKINKHWILHTKILGLYYSMKLCRDTGFKQVLCLSDSTNVVDFVQKNLNVHHKYENLIMAKNLLRRHWMVSIRHTFCEGNVPADFLTKRSALNDSRLVILHEAPSWYDLCPLSICHGALSLFDPSLNIFLLFYFPFYNNE